MQPEGSKLRLVLSSLFLFLLKPSSFSVLKLSKLFCAVYQRVNSDVSLLREHYRVRWKCHFIALQKHLNMELASSGLFIFLLMYNYRKFKNKTELQGIGIYNKLIKLKRYTRSN